MMICEAHMNAKPYLLLSTGHLHPMQLGGSRPWPLAHPEASTTVGRLVSWPSTAMAAWPALAVAKASWQSTPATLEKRVHFHQLLCKSVSNGPTCRMNNLTSLELRAKRLGSKILAPFDPQNLRFLRLAATCSAGSWNS